MTVAFLQKSVGFCNLITFAYKCYYLLIESSSGLCNSVYMADLITKLKVFLVCSFLPIYAFGERITDYDCLLISNPMALSDDESMPLCENLYPESAYNHNQNPWRIGLSAGIGQRSNPLLNARDIPVYGVLQISYFGDHFFFDNGDFGWRLSESENSSINAIAGVGGERSFYSFLNDSPISFLETVDVANGAVINEEAIKAPQRDLVVDGGIEWLWTYGNSDLQVQFLTDISNQHNGQEFWLSAGHTFNYEKWTISPSLGFNWKSDHAASYYYGVTQDESMPGLPAYGVGSAISAFFRFSANYALSAHWSIIALFQHEQLASNIINSPSVEDNQVTTSYLGLYYEF
jgi:outer membrane protein